MIDLHTHSTASDGTYSPAELVNAAVDAGITTLALTDHNSANGLCAFLQAAKGKPLRAVPGVEITCELLGEELHILALDLPECSFDKVQELMSEVLSRAEKSKRDMVIRLQSAGYRIDYDAIQAAHPDAVINRAHIAAALKEAGYVASVSQAFDTLLGEQHGYYRPAKRLQAAEAIDYILKLGAIPVWAHPFFSLEEDKVGQFLTVLVPEGLQGMEVYYSTYTDAQTKAAKRLCEKFGIKPSGGSDFHGSVKPDIALGIGKGSLNIPECIADRLLDRKADIPLSVRIERIKRMTALYEQIQENLAAGGDLSQAEQAIKTLSAYYQSPDWMSDFDADGRGEIPKSVNRGILTEDAIWDLLTSVHAIREDLP